MPMKFLKNILQPLLFTLTGSGLGLVYYQNFSCPTGSCPITSSAMSTMVYTGLIGLLVSYVMRESKKT